MSEGRNAAAAAAGATTNSSSSPEQATSPAPRPPAAAQQAGGRAASGLPALPPRRGSTPPPPPAAAAAAPNGPTTTSSSSSSSSSSRPAAAAGGRPAAVTVATGGSKGSSSVRAMPSLPARNGPTGAAGSSASTSAAGAAVVGVLDPQESEATQRLRARVHAIRVQLIRAARRLGYEHDNGLVKQVLYRLFLAEKLKEPFRKGSRRPDAAVLAARDASRLEAEQGACSPLDLTIKILVIGLTGSGKTSLIRSLLSMDDDAAAAAAGGQGGGGSNEGAGAGPAARRAGQRRQQQQQQQAEAHSSSSSSSSSGCAAAPEPPTRRVAVHTGRCLGVGLTLVDTPGLTAAAAGAAANAAALRAIKAAYKRHRPDLVLYVDRFDTPHAFGGDTRVLSAITRACGPAIWLNTIVTLTHAGGPSLGSDGSSRQPGAAAAAAAGGMDEAAAAAAWEAFSAARMQQLQASIREASGDARLMNPIAFADSHPGCSRNATGQLVLPNGVCWQQHLLVLMVSAKLLADAEAAMQASGDSSSSSSKRAAAGGAGGGAGGLDPSSMRQLMGRPEGPPVRYLMTLLTGFTQPLTYPDHGAVMELRSAQQRLAELPSWRERKELSRQIRFRLLQMRQMARRSQRTSDLLCKATRAGGKLQLAQPRTATRVRPSVQPPVGHRYRVLEPTAGWIVRPQIEPHGMDNADNVEGFMAEKAGVLRPAAGGSSSSSGSREPDLLSGLPYRVSGSASASKEQVLLQGRAEASTYHDAAGLATTSLSADLQTSGAAAPGAGAPDMLLVLRLDSQRRGFPVAANNPSVGLLVSRLAPESQLHKGPLAAGLRLQDCIRMSGPGGAPVELDMSLGRMLCRPGVEVDDAWGLNSELRTDARQLLGTRWAAPLSVSGSVLSHRGDTMAALAAAMQVQRGRRGRVGGKLQLNSRGVASLGLQVRSDAMQWWGLAGLIPLFNLGLQALRAAAGGRQGGGQGGYSEDGWDGSGDAAGMHEAAAAAAAAAAAEGLTPMQQEYLAALMRQQAAAAAQHHGGM